jgi:hypothetical protein
MKKIIMLAIVLTTIVGTAFSTPTDAVNKKVLTSFTQAFRNAENVQWEIRKDLFKATFMLNGEKMFAYYNAIGEQVALSRNLSTSQLPITLSAELKSGYNEYWLTDLFEVVTNGDTSYYATVQSATHITVLKADSSSGWVTFRKEKRK